jgi:threonine dehydrogenase-like Zn-dependent dehydrogenase
MRALRFDGSLKLVDDAPIPRREGEALVEVICAGICNTDLEIVRGYAGFRGVLGHEFVGRVIESPDAKQIGCRVVGEINAGCGVCRLCRAGDARHCPARTVLGIKDRDGAFADFLSLPAHNLLEVPDTLSDEEAVFAEPLAAALNILDQVEIAPTARVAVIGDGKLAQLIIRVMAQSGCALTVIGKHAEKLALAEAVGAHCLCLQNTSDERAIEDWLRRANLLLAFDVVIEISGSPTGLPMALQLVRPRGIVVLKSTHHGQTGLSLTAVVVNEVTIVGSRCGRLATALDWLANQTIDVRPFITEKLAIEDAIEAFAKATRPDSLKVLLRVSPSS